MKSKSRTEDEIKIKDRIRYISPEHDTCIIQPTHARMSSSQSAGSRSIYALCEEMKRNGYEYGSMIAQENLAFFTHRPESQITPGFTSAVSCFPACQTLNCSQLVSTHAAIKEVEMDQVQLADRLSKMNMDDTFDGQNLQDQTVATMDLIWRSQILFDGSAFVEEYSMRDLLFVKIAPSTVVAARQLENFPSLSSPNSNMHMFPWPILASKFSGILVDWSEPYDENVYSRFGHTWVAPTLAIWDPSCITDFYVAKNAGKPWTYLC